MVVERFADNDQHSHWELVDTATGVVVWAEGESGDDHKHAEIFSRYHDLKARLGELGYNTFIISKEVEDYRAWLRNDKYKHRLEWFEKTYPNGLFYEEDGQKIGANIMTRHFLAEADGAFGTTELAEQYDMRDHITAIRTIILKHCSNEEMLWLRDWLSTYQK